MTYTVPIFGTTPTLGVDMTTSGYDQPFSATASNPSTPEFPQAPFSIGQTIALSQGGSAVYAVTATATSITQGNFCYINSSMLAAGLTSAIAATAGQAALLGVSLATLTTGQYGWFQTEGYCPAGVTCVATTAINTTLHTSATAGVLTSSVVTGTSFPVIGVVLTATAATNNVGAACMINGTPQINTATTLG
jgi:hypothetical protein